MESGVYQIVNNVNGKCYVGSSINLHTRRLRHFNDLLKNKHENEHLQRAYNKYGKEAFEFKVIELLEIDDNIKEKLLSREQFWIDNLKPEYNILPVAGSSIGYRHTDEAKKKISKATKGVSKSEEHSKHIREAQKGRTFSEEHKSKLSESAKHRKSMSHHTIISINGIIYNSIKEASELTGIKYNTIQKRLKNPKFEEYYYINKNILPETVESAENSNN